MRDAAYVVHERGEALGQAGDLELIAQHGGQRQRHRNVLVEQVEQRQIAPGDRLPQPLLAERPCPEPLDVGHVRVQHDRQRAALAAGAHGRHTAMKSRARSMSAFPAGRSEKSDVAIAGVNQL